MTLLIRIGVSLVMNRYKIFLGCQFITERLQALTPNYAQNFQPSNGSFENFHIYDIKKWILKL